MASHVDGASLATLFQALRNPSLPNRAARVQSVCERFWDLVASDPFSARAHASDFVALLLDDDDLLLASFVIPDLRPEALPPLDKLKRELVESVAPRRKSLGYLAPDSQAKYNHAQPLYMDERAIREEVQLYRTCILMADRYAVDDAQLQLVRDWLEACPIRNTAELRSQTCRSQGKN